MLCRKVLFDLEVPPAGSLLQEMPACLVLAAKWSWKPEMCMQASLYHQAI